MPQQARSSVTLSIFKYILLMTTSGIAVIILLFLVGIWQSTNRFFGAIEAFVFPSPSVTTQVDIPTLIVDRVRGISELTTVEFVTEAVVPASEETKIGEFILATTKLIYIAHGEVRAGIDLNNLTSKDVELINDRILIHLPPPQILDSKIDVNRSRVYDYDRGFLSLGPDVAPQLQTLAQRQTLQKIVATACHKGVLEEANERAKLSIQKLLNAVGYSKIEIQTTSPSPEACNLTSQG